MALGKTCMTSLSFEYSRAHSYPAKLYFIAYCCIFFIQYVFLFLLLLVNHQISGCLY